MSYLDGESPDVMTTTHPKARKQHRCCECHGAIMPGEQYEKITGIWNGEPETYKTCAVCAAKRQEVRGK